MAVVEPALARALSAAAKACRAGKLRFMVIGGVAVISRGVVRATADVDLTVWSGTSVRELVALMAAQRIVPRIEDAADFARAHRVLLLRHQPTRTRIDLSLASLPFENEALARAESLTIGRSRIPVASVDDLIVYKAIAWRDRDRGDIERLARLHRGEIDLHRIRSIVDELSTLLDEPGRVAELDRLIERAVRTPTKRRPR